MVEKNHELSTRGNARGEKKVMGQASRRLLVVGKPDRARFRVIAYCRQKSIERIFESLLVMGKK